MLLRNCFSACRSRYPKACRGCIDVEKVLYRRTMAAAAAAVEALQALLRAALQGQQAEALQALQALDDVPSSKQLAANAEAPGGWTALLAAARFGLAQLVQALVITAPHRALYARLQRLTAVTMGWKPTASLASDAPAFDPGQIEAGAEAGAGRAGSGNTALHCK